MVHLLSSLACAPDSAHRGAVPTSLAAVVGTGCGRPSRDSRPERLPKAWLCLAVLFPTSGSCWTPPLFASQAVTTGAPVRGLPRPVGIAYRRIGSAPPRPPAFPSRGSVSPRRIHPLRAAAVAGSLFGVGRRVAARPRSGRGPLTEAGSHRREEGDLRSCWLRVPAAVRWRTCVATSVTCFSFPRWPCLPALPL